MQLIVGRLREWPRIVAYGVALAAVVLTVGLLVGATAASSTTTVMRTVTATVTQESPAQAARIQLDATAIGKLQRRLAVMHRRLRRADRELRRRHQLRGRHQRRGRHHPARRRTAGAPHRRRPRRPK